jgi:hypothetical protein
MHAIILYKMEHAKPYGTVRQATPIAMPQGAALLPAMFPMIQLPAGVWHLCHHYSHAMPCPPLHIIIINPCKPYLSRLCT